MMAPLDISGPVAEICARLGVAPEYVARLDITPTTVDATLYRGVEGRCKGRKLVGPDGAPLFEVVYAEVTT